MESGLTSQTRISSIAAFFVYVQALAVGAQMKIAHQLRSAEHISQRELERVLKGSLGTSFEVNDNEMEQMINGIMKVSVRSVCMYVHACACTCMHVCVGARNIASETQCLSRLTVKSPVCKKESAIL